MHIAETTRSSPAHLIMNTTQEAPRKTKFRNTAELTEMKEL